MLLKLFVGGMLCNFFVLFFCFGVSDRDAVQILPVHTNFIHSIAHMHAQRVQDGFLIHNCKIDTQRDGGQGEVIKERIVEE